MPAFRLTRVWGTVWIVLLASLLSSSMLPGTPTMGVAYAQDGRVREIRVAGNKRVEPETVRSYLKFSVGDIYDAGRVDQSIRALFATGLFADVRIDRAGTVVTVYVLENPIINQVAFEGNREIDTATLQSEVQLKPRSVFTRARVQADVQRILDLYRRQGRFAATVEPKIIEIEHNRVNLVFEINEGGATKVKAINFIGNRAFSDGQLRDIISTTQVGLFDFIKGNSIYDPDRLAYDRELLRQYYLKNGYADVRVSTGGAELDRDGSGFFITFQIEEGDLYRFGSVSIESSLPSINAASFRGELLTLSGQVFNASLMDKTVEKLTLAISEQGYAFARVRPRADRDAAARIINLVYVIDEGPRIYIERINVNGNTRTQDYVIRREFRLVEGDAYNPLLVDRAKKRLQSLGFFKAVDIKRRPGSTPDRVILDVDLVEQPTGELSFGAGYSTAEGVIGDISLTERNLFGNGQFIRLKLSGSIERLQIDLSFTEPRFLDRNLSAGFDVFHKDVNQSNRQAFRNRKTGASLRLAFPLAENLWMSTNYTLSRDEIYEVDTVLGDDGRIASRAIREAAGVTVTSSIGTSIAYDARNHPRSPTSGYYIMVSSDAAGLGGDVQYVRFTGEGRAYYPVTEKITIVGRILGGHIFGWGGDEVRLIDMFYKGGETIRGFDRSGIGPRDLSTNDALGGTTFWAATAEVRFPLPLIPDDLGMSGAFFVDAGSLFGASALAKRINGTNDPQTGLPVNVVDDSSVRVSAGASLLWNSPLGPLRADFGWALQKEVYDQTQVFRFGASTKF
jgi:outer membrane protein insertion porin family